LLKEKTILHQTGRCIKDINAQIKAAIDSAKQLYRSRKLDSMADNIKLAWQSIKAMGCINRSNNSNEIVMSHKESMSLASDLNKHYCRFDNDQSPINIPSTEFSLHNPFTPEEINNALSRIKPNKSSGPDHVSGLVINRCSFQLLAVFVKLFNLCLRKSYIPNLWKLAKIFPLPKSHPAKF